MLRAPGSLGPPQVGFVAARRVGNAVRRNRAKRRLREAMMKVELQANTAYIATMGFDELTRRLREAITSGEVAGPRLVP